MRSFFRCCKSQPKSVLKPKSEGMFGIIYKNTSVEGEKKYEDKYGIQIYIFSNEVKIIIDRAKYLSGGTAIEEFITANLTKQLNKEKRMVPRSQADSDSFMLDDIWITHHNTFFDGEWTNININFDERFCSDTEISHRKDCAKTLLNIIVDFYRTNKLSCALATSKKQVLAWNPRERYSHHKDDNWDDSFKGDFLSLIELENLNLKLNEERKSVSLKSSL